MRLSALDAVRFVCALFVVLHHIELLPFAERFAPDIYRYFFFGPSAVVVFFVISGFCIHIAYRDRDDIEWGSYFIRRYLRILPPILVIVLVGAMAGVSYAPYGGWVTWSLICELLYYTTYPALLPLCRRFGWAPIVLVSYAIGYATYSVVGQGGTSISDYPANIARDTLLFSPGWLLGAWLADVYANDIRPPIKNVWVMRTAVLALSFVLAAAHYRGVVHHNWTLPLLCAAAAMWLWAELYYGRWPAWLAKAGEWSYSLYLVHPAAFYGMATLFAMVPFLTARWIIAIGFILVASYVFYRLVEVPSHRMARHLARRVQAVRT